MRSSWDLVRRTDVSCPCLRCLYRTILRHCRVVAVLNSVQSTSGLKLCGGLSLPRLPYCSFIWKWEKKNDSRIYSRSPRTDSGTQSCEGISEGLKVHSLEGTRLMYTSSVRECKTRPRKHPDRKATICASRARTAGQRVHWHLHEAKQCSTLAIGWTFKNNFCVIFLIL